MAQLRVGECAPSLFPPAANQGLSTHSCESEQPPVTFEKDSMILQQHGSGCSLQTIFCSH
jgi:hypothetical protein